MFYLRWIEAPSTWTNMAVEPYKKKITSKLNKMWSQNRHSLWSGVHSHGNTKRTLEQKRRTWTTAEAPSRGWLVTGRGGGALSLPSTSAGVAGSIERMNEWTVQEMSQKRRSLWSGVCVHRNEQNCPSGLKSGVVSLRWSFIRGSIVS